MAQVEAKSESPGRESIHDALDRSLEETGSRLGSGPLETAALASKSSAVTQPGTGDAQSSQPAVVKT